MDHLKKRQRNLHPIDTSNFISNIFFCFALKLYRKGYKKDLEESDLYEVPLDFKAKKVGDELEAEFEKEKNKSVVRLLLRCYGWPFFLLGCVQLVIDLLQTLIEPWALGKFILCFTPGQDEVTKTDAHFYAFVLIGFNVFNRIYIHNYYFRLMVFGLKIRTALCSLLYRKALKLNPGHLEDVSIGKIVTLITKDVEVFCSFLEANDVWISIIRTIVASVILYNKIGVAALSTVGYFLVVMPLQIYLGIKVTGLKMKMCKKTDERLQVTQETLSAIRIIKMFTWEKLFDSKISSARRKEVNTTFQIYVLRYIILALGAFNRHLGLYLLLMTYVWFGNQVKASVVYFIMSTFQTIGYSLAIVFPIGVYQTAELKAAIKRVGHVLKATEVTSGVITTDLPKITLKNVAIKIKNQRVLQGINLDMKRGLNLITGSVGSGKSLLLKTILQDYTLEKGSVTVEGTVSYASQEPWLFPSSIKQNILFGQEFEEKRYQEVLRVCALIYDFRLLEEGDGTIVEDRGVNLSKGQQARINLARAVYKKSDIYLLDDSLTALDEQVSTYIFKECIMKFLHGKLVVLVSNNTNHQKFADKVVIINGGKVQFEGKASELTVKESDDSTNEKVELITETTTEKKVYQETKQSGSVDWACYKKYLQLGGGCWVLLGILCIFIFAQWTISFGDKLISEWVNIEESFSNATNLAPKNTSSTRMFNLYTLVTLGIGVSVFGRAFAMFTFAKRSSLAIHQNMITTILNASMKFFDTHFIGNILNRFSKDLVTIDDTVPFVIYYLIMAFLSLAGMLILIISVNVTFLIPTLVFLTVLVLIRRYCVRTARSLKRLESLTRSPVVGYLNASLEGLATIRAYKTETIMRDEFDKHLDHYSSAYFCLYSSMRAFGFASDIISCVFISIIILRFVFGVDDGTMGGDVGLAITQALHITGMLQWGVRQWTEVENQMTSVERVLEYTSVKTETKQGLRLENWPKYGEIKYENVYLTYTNSNEQVLKNINFVANPKEKIGIVGRTGAGKSSIISTLFRLYEVEGKITIDGFDIKTLSLDFLRANISIIPQDPVLFSGTVRDNIDPIRQYSDDEIWSAIETANLKQLVPCLDFDIVNGGANFSIGQKQLFCLARAVIKKNKIIVLDEATASMDPDTDTIIHQTIQKNFSSCTVVTIAHKLHSVISNDKVMVLDKGEIMEFDRPCNLLKNKTGSFYQMVTRSGLLPPNQNYQ